MVGARCRAPVVKATPGGRAAFEHVVRDWQEEDYGGTGGTKGRNTSGEATGPPGHDFIPGGV